MKGELFFEDKPGLCTLIASICLTSCFCVFFSLLSVTLNRYICVCHHSIYSRIFSRKKNVAMCLLIWVLAFVCEMPNYLWDRGHIFDVKNHSCIWNRTSMLTYTMVVSILFIWVPLVVMIACYVRIFQNVISAKVKVHSFGVNAPTTLNNMKLWKAAVRSSRNLFIILAVSVVLWFPYSLVIVIDHNDTMSVAVHLYVTLLAHLHSSTNSVIYLLTNRQLRKRKKTNVDTKTQQQKCLNKQ